MNTINEKKTASVHVQLKKIFLMCSSLSEGIGVLSFIDAVSPGAFKVFKG